MRIEQTAQAILDARAKYPDCSLADFYDEVTMPPELRKAHQDNDRAVMARAVADDDTLCADEPTAACDQTLEARLFQGAKRDRDSRTALQRRG